MQCYPYGWAASHLNRFRAGSRRCILLPWCSGIRPNPLAGNSTGERSSGGCAKIKSVSGVYLPRKVHTWFACIACVRNATFPSPFNDHNNRLSVIGSYWSVRGFRVCIVACMRCSSFQAPARPGPRAALFATLLTLPSLFGAQCPWGFTPACVVPLYAHRNHRSRG